jgi:hypothetical protein
MVGLDAGHDEVRHAIIAMNRCECLFARSPGKLLARCSPESCGRGDRSDLR